MAVAEGEALEQPPAKRPRSEVAAADGTERQPASAAPASGQSAPPPASGQSASEPPAYNADDYIAADGGWWAHRGGQWLYNLEERTYFHLTTGTLHLSTDEGIVSLSAASEGNGSDAAADAGTSADAPERADGPGRQRGAVKWFNAAKGFGFIEVHTDDSTSSPDVFVHRNQLTSADDADVFASPKPGTEVTFLLGETDNGRPCAVDVRFVEIEEAAEEESKAEAGDEDGESAEAGDDDAESSGSSIEIDLFEDLVSGTYTVKGTNKDQCEDFAVQKVKIPISVLGETATCVFFGVFDGHGGGYCAEYAAAHLAKNVLSRLRDRAKSVSDEVALKTALLGGFKQTDHNFLQHAKRVGEQSGSTACTMTVFGPDENMRLRLFLANVGDSRAVLGRINGEAIRLTEDHKPNLPGEKKRVELEGGSVVQVGEIWRCILPAKKRQATGIAGLAVSRALGDKEFKHPDIVSAEPEIFVHEVDWDEDEFVIIASDGIWDVISDKEAVKIVQQKLHLTGNEDLASEALVRRAVEKSSHDDCTVVVVRFGWNKAAAALLPAKKEEREEDELEEEGEEEQKEVDEEEEEDNDDEEQPTAAPAAASAAASSSSQGAKEDFDLFAAADEQEEEAEAAPVVEKSLAETDKKGLFEGLTPTQEEMALPAGPALPQDQTVRLPSAVVSKQAKDEEDAPPPTAAVAADEDLDMFG
mmetsp:Transcript_83461/g.153265  ORF Transcript_83461/g.153265 Transcript_83461/m.153265 type:complete len:700 (-) Transcript_83461:37-2136(-)